MGTDIHLAVEAKDDEGNWFFVPGPIVACWACDGTGKRHEFNQTTRQRIQIDQPCWSCTKDGSTSEYDGEDGESDRAYYRMRYVEPGKTRDRWWSDRSYIVFAILGNVRNGRGFAGVETHMPLPYISDCRGIPDDVTPETLEVLSNEHSGTWCTLADVMTYDWKQGLHNSGVISLQTYARLRKTGEAPTNWSGSIDGRGIQTVTMRAADVLIKEHNLDLIPLPSRAVEQPNSFFGEDAEPINGVRYYVRYRWTDPLEKYTEHFQERMRQLAGYVGERECRLIMDFDS